MSDARAQIEISATTSQLAAGLRRASSMMAGFASGVRAGMKKIGGGAAGSFLGNVGADLAGRGIDLIKDQAVSVHDFETNLMRLGIATKKNRGDLDAMRTSFRETSRATGISSNEIAAASRVYFDLTSDTEGVTTAMSTFAKVAQATGSSMEDITNVAAAMRGNLGLTAGELESAFSGLVEQGNEGKVGLRDMAGEFVRLLPTYKKFAGATGRAGLMDIGAAFQVVAKDFGSASEAATGLDQMMLMFVKRQAQLKKAGVKVFEKKDGVVQMREMSKIIDDIREKMPDIRKHGKILGDDAQARRALNALIEGEAAYERIQKAGDETKAISRDFGTVTESSAGKITLAMNNAKEAMAEAFTPERIEAFANAISSLADKLPGIVDKLGAMADVAGKIPGVAYDVGKSVRGVFADDRPFKDARDEAIAKWGEKLNEPIGAGDRMKRMAETPGYIQARQLFSKLTPEQQRDSIAAAKARVQERARASSTAHHIIGGEVNERASEESVRRAVVASMSPDQYGARRAGEAYLEAAKVSEEKIAAVTQAEFNKSMIPKIVDAIRLGFEGTKPTEVRIGDNQVAKSASKATDPRRGVKP